MMAVTNGIHHLGLTVPNLTVTRNFLVDILGFQQVGEVPDYPAIFVSDGSIMLTLWQAIDPEKATPFDRKSNIGLHHFALKVANLEVLHTLHQTLKNTTDVIIEFAPEPLGGGTTHHMMCYIPSGIRVEFIAVGE